MKTACLKIFLSKTSKISVWKERKVTLSSGWECLVCLNPYIYFIFDFLFLSIFFWIIKRHMTVVT